MNWYKLANFKYGSYSLELPKKAYWQIDEILKKILNFYKNVKTMPQSPIFIGTISFENIYTNKESISNIYINNKIVSINGGTIAYRDRINGNIYFNIIKERLLDLRKNKDYNKIKNEMKSELTHEITHSIDLKIVNLNIKYPPNTDRLFTPTEFDAYSKEIINYVKNAYKIDKNKEIIKKWLIFDNFEEIDENMIRTLNMPEQIFQIIQYWKKNNKKDFLKRLRQRLFMEVISNDNNIRQNQRSKKNNEK